MPENAHFFFPDINKWGAGGEVGFFGKTQESYTAREQDVIAGCPDKVKKKKSQGRLPHSTTMPGGWNRQSKRPLGRVGLFISSYGKAGHLTPPPRWLLGQGWREGTSQRLICSGQSDPPHPRRFRQGCRNQCRHGALSGSGKHAGRPARPAGTPLQLPPLPDEALAALVCTLAESGVGVVGLTAQTKSLEDIFLSLTQTSGEVARWAAFRAGTWQKPTVGTTLLSACSSPALLRYGWGGLVQFFFVWRSIASCSSLYRCSSVFSASALFMYWSHFWHVPVFTLQSLYFWQE